MKDIKWEMEIGELVSSGYGGGYDLLIYAVKEGEERRQIGSVGDLVGAIMVEQAAREAVEAVARLNAGFTNPKGGIAERFLDAVESMKPYVIPQTS